MNLKEFINAYHKLSYSDRVVFYSTVTNNVDINAENLQDFLTKNRGGDKMTAYMRLR